jgi:mannose-1-phosphate guanylyltransferase
MKAVILVGGEATRLRPLTCNTPKAMVPVLNTPFLEHVIHYLNQHQVTEIVLALSQRQQFIEDYFGDGTQFGVRLRYSVEDIPLGTGGAVKNAEKYLDETFLVLNGDIFTDLDITAMMNFHRNRKAKVTISLTPADDPTSYGLVETNAQNRITRFLEKPSPSEVTTNMINAGIYILEPDILTQIPPQVSFSFERELFPPLVDQSEPVYAYPSSAYWIDIGTPEKYLQLHRDLLSGKSSRHTLPSERLIGEQSHIHPTAQINGTVVIGNNCNIESNVMLTGPAVIGSGCTIQTAAIIRDSVIWHNVQIGPRAMVKSCALANGCCLNADCMVESSTLGDNVIVISGCQLKPASKIWPGIRVEADT